MNSLRAMFLHLTIDIIDVFQSCYMVINTFDSMLLLPFASWILNIQRCNKKNGHILLSSIQTKQYFKCFIDGKRMWPFFLLHHCIFHIHDANGRRSILSKVFITIVKDWKTSIISIVKLRNIARNELNLLLCHLLIY